LVPKAKLSGSLYFIRAEVEIFYYPQTLL